MLWGVYLNKYLQILQRLFNTFLVSHHQLIIKIDDDDIITIKYNSLGREYNIKVMLTNE